MRYILPDSYSARESAKETFFPGILQKIGFYICYIKKKKLAWKKTCVYDSGISMPYHTFLAFLQIREETLDVYRNYLTLFAYDVQGIRKNVPSRMDTAQEKNSVHKV